MWARRKACAPGESYFHEGRAEDAKTGTLVREAADVDYIVVANNKEALALENNLIKQKKPRFNILLRDDKTYPYIKLTLGERYPAGLRHPPPAQGRQLILRPVLPCQPGVPHRGPDPSAFPDSVLQSGSEPLSSATLPAVLHRALPGPVRGRTHHSRAYQEAVRDVKMFLEGRPTDLSRSLRERMAEAAEAEEYERAAKYRDLISTVEQLQEKQRIAAVEGDDADVFGYHYENGMLAVNLFHMRGGKSARSPRILLGRPAGVRSRSDGEARVDSLQSRRASSPPF